MKIISGGQTGADWGALQGARENGWETGGTAPKGWFNEIGRQEHAMRSFGLKECTQIGYPARSMKNVDDAQLTIVIVWDKNSAGTMKTIGYAQTKKWKWADFEFTGEQHRPTILITEKIDSESLGIYALRNYIKEYGFNIINVAGHRESSHPGIQEFTKQLIMLLK